jgi:hypothetical protein
VCSSDLTGAGSGGHLSGIGAGREGEQERGVVGGKRERAGGGGEEDDDG